MEDKDLPASISAYIPPSIKQDELCRRLDSFYEYLNPKLNFRPSVLLRGAWNTIQHKENPDWMAQSAHSLREVIYPIWSDRIKLFRSKREKALKDFGAVLIDEEKVIKKIDDLYSIMCDIAHHGVDPKHFETQDEVLNITSKKFKEYILEFEDILFLAIRRQTEIHWEIDFLLNGPPEKVDPKQMLELLQTNPDSYRYFFSVADEKWLDWFWKNGFLDVIKQKAEDTTHTLPELNYLVRVAEKKPDKVVEIMLSVPISEENFNTGVIDRFTYICSELPVKQLSKVVTKIRNEKWVYIMRQFNRWGYEYEKMFKILSEAKYYESILTLAEAVLTIKRKEENSSPENFTETPFCFKNLSYIKVFEYLILIDDSHLEKTIELTINVLKNVILFSKRHDGDEVFEINEGFYLFDVDLFTLNLGEREHLTYEDDICNLLATIKILTERFVEKNKNKPEEVRKIYQKYTHSLPDSRTSWRLKLFVLGLSPEVLKEEFKKAIFRIFETDRYYKFTGPEYLKILQTGFFVLLDGDKREYIKKVFEYFGQQSQDEKEQERSKIYGWKILSCICRYLTETENKKCKEVFGKECDSDFEPEPTIRRVEARAITPQPPISCEEFKKLSLPVIAKRLRNEWTPENLCKLNKNGGSFKPVNAEGITKCLAEDIPERFQDYIEKANLFFERDVLDPHYTYSYLRNIYETIRDKKINLDNINWDGLINFLSTIQKSGEEIPFDTRPREYDVFDTWLSGWRGVHSAMAEVLKEILNKRIVVDFSKYRDKLFEIIKYLLKYPDPVPEDEEPDSAKIKVESYGEGYLVSDPFTIAINSVRGKAFETFVFFVHRDGTKLADDVKELYISVLKKENTRAIMFLFGHYLPSFYYRDRKWIKNLLPQIFPKTSDKKHLYLAAWEGYLANDLYEDIFFDPDIQKLYEEGLSLSSKDDPNRKYFINLEEGIASHLALAFVHFKEFGFKHSLFESFWKRGSLKHKTSFISFIGRAFISANNSKIDELMKNKPEIKERLKELWDWIFTNCSEPEIFAEFGYWINTEKNIFDVQWLVNHIRKTFEKSNGILSWEYGLTSSIVQLAETVPQEVLTIIRLYFLGIGKGQKMGLFYLDNKWIEAFKVLSNNIETRIGIRKLISELILKGGSIFWKLKEVLE